MTDKQIYCTHCGAKQNASAKFCSECGTAILSSAVEESSSTQPTQKDTAPSKEPKPNNKPKKNKWLKRLLIGLAILIGGFFIAWGISNMMDAYHMANPPLASDEDFEGSVNGEFVYIGDDPYVEIPHVIKSVDITSYEGMFKDSNVRVVESTNPNVTDMSYMFENSTAKHLDLSQLDTSGVEEMDYMFYVSSADTIDLSNFDTSNVTTMESMFALSTTPELDLRSFDTSNVVNMNAMFNFTGVSTLDLSNFNTENVQFMHGMFADSQATSIDVSSFDTSRVSDMGVMFMSSQAPTIDLRNFDTYSLSDDHTLGGAYNMFMNASTTEVLIGDQPVMDTFETYGDAPDHLQFTLVDY